MALGDGIRRNIRSVSPQERDRFTRALLALQSLGGTSGIDGAHFPPGHWIAPEDIRTAGAPHGPEFLPWHRYFCNRLEQLLREIDPELSLHYWNWNEDPHELFGPAFMDADRPGAPFEGLLYRGEWASDDEEIFDAPTFERMRVLLARKHDAAHFVYFGGHMANAHISLHDPLGVLLHANVDRLFAMWQAREGHAWRLDPGHVYGTDAGLLGSLVVGPWPAHAPARPWLASETVQPRTYLHRSIVAPPCYDTLHTRVVVDEATNPGQVINFNEVYAGKTFARAASIQVFGGGNVTFEVTEGPTGPYTIITPGGTVTAAHAPSLYQEARIWFGFTGDRPGTSAPPGKVTIRCRTTGQTFVFRLMANTIALPAAGAVLALDRSAGRPNPAALGACREDVTWTWTWRPAAG
jgi:hypothetical protein